jgi:hypothetical protein
MIYLALPRAILLSGLIAFPLSPRQLHKLEIWQMKMLRRLMQGAHSLDHAGGHRNLTDNEVRKTLEVPSVASTLSCWGVKWMQEMCKNLEAHSLLLAALHGEMGL